MYASNGVGGCITGEQQPGRVSSKSTSSFARISPRRRRCLEQGFRNTGDGRGACPYPIFFVLCV